MPKNLASLFDPKTIFFSSAPIPSRRGTSSMPKRESSAGNRVTDREGHNSKYGRFLFIKNNCPGYENSERNNQLVRTFRGRHLRNRPLFRFTSCKLKLSPVRDTTSEHDESTFFLFRLNSRGFCLTRRNRLLFSDLKKSSYWRSFWLLYYQILRAALNYWLGVGPRCKREEPKFDSRRKE